MSAMGLPALKERFETLAAETRSRSQDVTRAAEAVSITMGNLIRASNSLVSSLDKVKSLMLSGGQEIRDFLQDLDDSAGWSASDMADCASLLATMKRFHRSMARPYFQPVDGRSTIEISKRIETLGVSTPAEGRTVRRVAQRIREAAEDCEKQRVRFVSTLDDLEGRVEALAAARFDRIEFRDAYVKALGKGSIKRFPTVNAYLAR